MSVSSMANLAYARRNDVAPVGEGLDSTGKVARETGQKPDTTTPATSAIASMAAYIPTEVITVYVAVLAAIGIAAPDPTVLGVTMGVTTGQTRNPFPFPLPTVVPSATAPPSEPASIAAATVASTPFPVYALFIVLMPFVVWGLYARTVKAANKPLPKSFGSWPKWEMVAGTVAFAIWAAALPSSPLAQFSWFSAAVTGVSALVVSMLIGVFAPLFASSALKDS